MVKPLPLSWFLVGFFSLQVPGKPLNVLFIFTDDHAYQAISAYGSNRNKTPCIHAGNDHWSSPFCTSLKITPPHNLNKAQKAGWDAAYGPKNQLFKQANLQGDELLKWKYQRLPGQRILQNQKTDFINKFPQLHGQVGNLCPSLCHLHRGSLRKVSLDCNNYKFRGDDRAAQPQMIILL